MPELGGLGKLLITAGVVLVVAGALLTVLDKVPGLGGGSGWFGRLPGDLFFKRDRVTFYFPIATSVLISVVLSVLLYLISFFFKR